jgi:hypothetical protein
MHEEWYYNNIKEIADENKDVSRVVKTICVTNHERKDRYKGDYPVLFSYMGVASLL